MTNRPSDKATAEVVAKWKGWENGCKYRSWLPRPFKENPDGTQYGDYDTAIDPRMEPQAAMELMLHLLCTQNWSVVCYSQGVFGINDESGEKVLPKLQIYGQEFCYAVVNLGIKVFGIEEEASDENKQ